VAQRYSIDENKIKVIPVSSGKKYEPITTQAREDVKEKYAEGKEYFLFNGSIHPQSNLLNLLKAFSFFKKRQKSNMQLIIASPGNAEDPHFIKSLSSYKYKSEIKLLTGIEETYLMEITASAYACINTSPLHHGIAGLLNAMECGVPVIAVNLKVVIEMLGDAALLVNAEQPENIAEKLMLLYKDENKRNGLIQKGTEQAAKYNLFKTADMLWQNVLTAMQPA
jgi:glycosyltransferase involved in cell wall biosynthesis